MRKATNTNKIIIDKKEAKEVEDTKDKAREIEIKTKIIEVDTKVNAEIVTTIVITTTYKKRLLKLREQFVYIYISLIFKTILILLSYLLLFNNL